MRTPATSLLALAAATAVLLGGCGGSSGGAGGGGAYGGGMTTGSTPPPKTTAAATPKPAAATATPAAGPALALTAKESGGLSFAPAALQAKAGAVTLALSNPGGNSAPHAIAIQGAGVSESGQIAQPGGTSSVSVTLKPGTYTFYCPVGNHRAQGMEGTLTVG
jgi:plastocyanin